LLELVIFSKPPISTADAISVAVLRGLLGMFFWIMLGHDLLTPKSKLRLAEEKIRHSAGLRKRCQLFNLFLPLLKLLRPATDPKETHNHNKKSYDVDGQNPGITS